MTSISPQLWRNLRVYQIYGANTDVGKTVITTLLGKGIQNYRPGDSISYIKPISTGPSQDSDAGFVSRLLGGSVNCKTLYQFDEPVSPHIAAKTIVPDGVILHQLAKHINDNAQRGPGFMFVETAGGPNSPAPSGITQADLYRPLRLPVILIGDAKLGGISTTISAFESLRLRGYDTTFVALQVDAQLKKYQNYEYLWKYFNDFSVPVFKVTGPPLKQADPVRDMDGLNLWLNSEMMKQQKIEQMVSLMASDHRGRIESLGTTARSALNRIWWPFTQHKSLNPADITVIDSAYGDNFQTFRSSTLPTVTNAAVYPNEGAMEDSLDTPDVTNLLQSTWDGSSSWWTQGLGHGNPILTSAAAYAAGRYGHVMFAQAIHRPALALATVLLKSMPGYPSKVFFSDNGSTGTEVAVKMGLRAACQRYGWDHVSQEIGIIGLQGSYHGDTIGSMDMSEPGTFNKKVEWYRGRGFWFSPPKVKMLKGKWVIEMPQDLQQELGPTKTFDTLADVFNLSRKATICGITYERYIKSTIERLTKVEGRKFGALVMEPIVLGAGGMILVDPLFQLALVKVVRQNPNLFASAELSPSKETEDIASDWTVNVGPEWRGLPVIHDEVFTGLYRLGRLSSSRFLNVQPDIFVHAKLLTGGLVPLCVTMAKEVIYNAFLSDSKEDALLHGHSYTAHPVGCQVALTSVALLNKMARDGTWDSFKRDWAPLTGSAMRGEESSSKSPLDEIKEVVNSVLNKATQGPNSKIARTSEEPVVSTTEGVTQPESPDQLATPYASQRRKTEDTGDSTRPSASVWSWWSNDFVTRLSFEDQVEGVWALGSVLAISLHDEAGTGYTSGAAKGLQQRLLAGTPDFNIHSRTLGNVIYFMCSQTSKLEDVRRWEQVIEQAMKMSVSDTGEDRGAEKGSEKIVEAYDTRTFL